MEAKHQDGNDDSDDSRQPESVAAVLKVFAILQALPERSEIGISEPLGCTNFPLGPRHDAGSMKANCRHAHAAQHQP